MEHYPATLGHVLPVPVMLLQCLLLLQDASP